MECPICYEEKELVNFSPCNHSFCGECVVKMMTTKCPMCRTMLNGSVDGNWAVLSVQEVNRVMFLIKTDKETAQVALGTTGDVALACAMIEKAEDLINSHWDKEFRDVPETEKIHVIRATIQQMWPQVKDRFQSYAKCIQENAITPAILTAPVPTWDDWNAPRNN